MYLHFSLRIICLGLPSNSLSSLLPPALRSEEHSEEYRNLAGPPPPLTRFPQRSHAWARGRAETRAVRPLPACGAFRQSPASPPLRHLLPPGVLKSQCMCSLHSRKQPGGRSGLRRVRAPGPRTPFPSGVMGAFFPHPPAPGLPLGLPPFLPLSLASGFPDVLPALEECRAGHSRTRIAGCNLSPAGRQRQGRPGPGCFHWLPPQPRGGEARRATRAPPARAFPPHTPSSACPPRSLQGCGEQRRWGGAGRGLSCVPEA